MGVVFTTDPASPCQELSKSWQLPLTRSQGSCFGPRKSCWSVLICSRWSNPSKHHGVWMNGKSWQYELQHRHAETGAASWEVGRLLARQTKIRKFSSTSLRDHGAVSAEATGWFIRGPWAGQKKMGLFKR